VPHDQSGGLAHKDKTLEKCYKVKVSQDQWWAGTWRQDSGKVLQGKESATGQGHGEKTLIKCYKVK
jgi:hypothetical protein